MADQVELRFNPDHALTVLLFTWHALADAIGEVAELTGDPELLERLRDKMLQLPKRQITEFEEGMGFSHPAFARHLRNFEPDAVQSAIDVINAAVDRVDFR